MEHWSRESESGLALLRFTARFLLLLVSHLNSSSSTMPNTSVMYLKTPTGYPVPGETTKRVTDEDFDEKTVALYVFTSRADTPIELKSLLFRDVLLERD